MSQGEASGQFELLESENIIEIERKSPRKEELYSPEGSPIIPVKSRTTKEKIIERLLFNSGRFEDRQALFNVVNFICLALTLYNLTSIVNIEGQQSLKLYDQTAVVKYKHWKQQGFTVYYLIIILVMVHLVKLFTSLVGIFCIFNKSEKLLTVYIMLTFTCIILRGIITILLLINYAQIHKVCEQVFGTEDDVATVMAIQFTIILGVFMCVEVIMGMASLLLAGQAKKYYKIMRLDEKKMTTHYYVAYNLMLRQYTY